MGFKDGLSDETLKSHPSLANFETADDIAKSYISSQAAYGAEKIFIPREEDTDNWNIVYNRLGRPEKAEGYKLPDAKELNLPEGFQIPEESVKSFLTNAHKYGLTQKQARALYTDHIAAQAGEYSQIITKMNDDHAASDKALRGEYGKAYDAQVALANKTMVWAAGGDKDLASRLSDKYGNDPDFIKAMAFAGNQMSEDILGPGAPKPGQMTPESAKEEISAIENNPKHPYHVADNPDHKAALAKMESLYALAYPGEEED